MLNYVKLAFRNIFRNRTRTFITVAAVFCAVIFAMLMRSMQFGTYDNMIQNVVGFYTGYAKVNQKGFWEEKSLDNTLLDSPALRQKIIADPNVKSVVPRLETFALAASEELTKGVIVTGIDPIAEANVSDVEAKMVDGNYFALNDKSVIVSTGLAEFLEIEIGDTLVLLGQGYQQISAAGKYPVVGTMKFGSPDLNANMVFMPLLAAQYLYGCEDRLTSIIPIVNKIKRIDRAKTSLQSSLGEEYEVLAWSDMLPELIQLIEADNTGGKVMLSILYIIIGFGMFGTILMMTTERLYEFGVLISIGMKRWKLILVIIMESLFINFLGVIIGMVLGFPILYYFFKNPIQLNKFGGNLDDFSEQYNIEPVLNFSLDPEVFYSQGIYVFIIACIITAYPIWKLWKLNVIGALRG